MHKRIENVGYVEIKQLITSATAAGSHERNVDMTG